ncbi:hypothetical protein BKA69DRAFT_1086774 [Paraphysoderma sedebokerense]|nr:hypothetical protein BKA69DRAFT_1086774 [Paraphysoderma sedebokerense]
MNYLAEEADFYKASYCDSVEAMDSSTSRSNSVSDILTSTQQQIAAIETSSTSVDEISAMFNTMSLLSDAYATVSAVQSGALREELQATESELQAIAYSTSEKEARIAQLTSELHGIQRSVDDKHLKYKLRIQELEHSLQNSEVRYKELEKKLLKEKELQSKSMKMDYDKLKDEFNQLEKKFRANRMTAEEKQSLTSRLNEFESENSRLQQDLQAEQEKFQSLAEEHIQVTATLQHQIDTLSGVSSFAEHEASKLNELNASLLGHHNQKQRIKYVAKIKEENLSLKKENLLLSKARDQCRMKIMNLERELEAFTSIDNTGKKRGRVEKAVLGTQFDKENASTLF